MEKIQPPRGVFTVKMTEYPAEKLTLQPRHCIMARQKAAGCYFKEKRVKITWAYSSQRQRGRSGSISRG